jgi:hypothetical protein
MLDSNRRPLSPPTKFVSTEFAAKRALTVTPEALDFSGKGSMHGYAGREHRRGQLTPGLTGLVVVQAPEWSGAENGEIHDHRVEEQHQPQVPQSH